MIFDKNNGHVAWGACIGAFIATGPEPTLAVGIATGVMVGVGVYVISAALDFLWFGVKVIARKTRELR